MAESNENVPTDTTSLRYPRRSSMRRAGRPPFDDVDTNVTGDVTERRRQSKRVSFSDTNQIKIFEREQSGELGSSADNAAAPTLSGAVPVTAVDDNTTKREEADQLLPFQCSAHEQSFYLEEADENDDCSPRKKISPLEDALSCLMFGRGSAPNRTTLADENMDLTGNGASSSPSTSPLICVNRTTLAHESIELTNAAISVCDTAASPSPTSPRIRWNRTMFAVETMELTKAAMSMCDQNVSLAPSPSPLNLNQTRRVHETMDFTRGAISICDDPAEPTGTRFFPNHPMEITAAGFSPRAPLALPFGKEVTSYGPDTMNVTCVVSEESPCGDKLPTGEDGAVSALEVNRDECLSPPFAEPTGLPTGILQMLSQKNSSTSWWDESPEREGTAVEGRMTPTPAPGIETHSEQAASGIPMAESTLSGTNLASSKPHQMTLATQLGALNLRAADGEEGVADSGSGLGTAKSEPVPSEATASVAGGSSLHCPPVEMVLAADDVGTLEVNSSKSIPGVLEGASSDVVSLDEASFGKTQHVSAMMDMTCASSRPVFAADKTVPDPSNRELAPTTIMPLDDMEVTCGVTKTVEGQMSMTCADMTGFATNLLDATCPSAGPGGMPGVGTPTPACASDDLGRGVGAMSDTLNAATGVEENAACSLIEDPRFRRADISALHNTAAGHAINANLTGHLQIEATLTKVHHSFAVSSSRLAPDVASPTNDYGLGVESRDVPLSSEGQCPSFLEGTPKRGHTNRILSRSGTPANCTPARRGTSASKRAGTSTSGVVVMSCEESVALQLLVSPANKSVTRARTPTRSSNTAPPPSSSCRSASLKKSVGKAHKALNDALDSTGAVPPGWDVSALLGTSVSCMSSVPAGLDVSALLATSAHSIGSSKILDDVFSPARRNAQGMNSSHSGAVGALKRWVGASQQERGSSSSQVPDEHGGVARAVSDLDKTGAETGAKDQADALPLKERAGAKSANSAVGSHSRDAARTCSTVDKVHPTKQALATEAVSARNDHMQDAALTNPSTCGSSASVLEPQRKSTTFVVNAGCNRNSATFVLDPKGRPSATFVINGKTRPSETFTVASAESGVLSSRDSRSSVDAEPLLAASGLKPALTSSCSHSEPRRHEPNGKSDRGSSIQSTVTPRSRKRLQFADVVTGSSFPEHSASHGGASVNRTREGTLTSATKPRQLSEHNGSSNLQQSLGNRSDAVGELMDISAPSFVPSSDEGSIQQSLPACPNDARRDGTNFGRLMVSLPTEQPEGCGADLAENSSACSDKAIPTVNFYSASSSFSARKRAKPSPPSPPRTKSAQKAASTSKKRSAKGAPKRHLQATPTTAHKRSKGSKAVRSSHRKEPVPRKSTPKTSRRALKSLEQERADGVTSERNDESFSYGVRLQSVPTSPVEKAGGSEATQAKQVPNDPGSHPATEVPASMELEEKEDPGKELFDDVDPELDLTAGIGIEAILERLDDANVEESLYWSVHQLPKALQEKWQLRIVEAVPHKAVFTFAGDLLEVAVALGEFVEDPGACTDEAVKDAVSGKVRRRTKRLAAVGLRVCRNAKCGPFSKFLCRRLIQQYRSGELLVQRYPTTDLLGEMLGEVGGHFVWHRDLSHDIRRATCGPGRFYVYTFSNDSVLSIEVSQPDRLVWFHMDLPIDLDAYPHKEILPSSRPYSGPVLDPGDEYITIRTEKLRRITARVAPGPQYLARMVDELDAFINKR
ncbi:uncharacterized protein LOC144142729 [Haemaphysalis longicornis]